MRNRGQAFIGVSHVLNGLMFLLGELLDVDVWKFCWPVAIILLGVWLLFRPRLVGPDTRVRQRILGDIRRYGSWQVADEEIWIGIGDVKLDMTEADVPLGETRIRVFGFVGDVDLFVPEDVGVEVCCTAFVSEVKGLGRKRENFVGVFTSASENYGVAERKVRLETTFFVNDVRVRQV
jgi:predicted membrane protein